MSTSSESHFVTHSSSGVSIWTRGPKSTGPPKRQLIYSNEQHKQRPALDCFISDDGQYLAVLTSQSVLVYRQDPPNSNFTTKVFLQLDVPEPKFANFSPKSNSLAVVTSFNTTADQNLKIFSLATGNVIYESQDKRRESIRWTHDEKLAYRLHNSELIFYQNNDFSKVDRRLLHKNLVSFQLAHNERSGCTYVAVFVKGVKGAPNAVKVYCYPHFDNVIVQQSLFKADSVEIKWNSKGDAMLLMATKDVDTTGKSYYGESSLHFLDLKGTACSVGGKKEGSAHSCQWLPNNEGFIAVYGRMPAAITLYNTRAEATFQFGEAPVNSIYLNPFSNLVAFAGFGNLSGDVHVWNLQTRSRISHFLASDTTHLCWTADGTQLVSSTHHARLKVANGFKIWNFLGNLEYTHDCNEKQSEPLYKILSVVSTAFPKPDIAANVKGKFVSQNPVKKYIPPHLRNAQQQKEADKRQQMLKNPGAVANGLTPVEKKIRNLTQKLEQIATLKKSLSEGKELEKNQLEKIARENDLAQQLEALKLQV